MLITVADITNKEFKRGLRGYNVDDVDEFLDKIAQDFEAVNKENSNLKEKLKSAQEKLDHYNKMENTIQNTLLLAQNASDQAKENAKKESELIVKNANETSKKVIDKAHNDVIQINDEFERVKQEFVKFRSKYRNFMESQLEMFDDMEKNFVKNYNIGYEESQNLGTNEIPVKEKEIEVVPDKDENDNKNDISNIEVKDEVPTKDEELEEIKNFFIKG
ncbi:cell division initiation protein [Clostridium algifaecis]|uniref:Cell division initiation protein n=1 Tax=Clostridium algifaecis TaxID=1472040 RepID=A0ABS4KN27_9CLOT|nr:cell division initiation protein [Clostridium algifaecis]